MTDYGTRAPGALSRALIDAVEAHLDARQWRAEGTAWGIDWHHERAAARVVLRPGVLLVYRGGARTGYIENPRARDVEGALVRAGVISSPGPAGSAAGRARVPRGARAGAGAPWAGGRGSAGS
jgi:hypothetical protein